MKKRILLLMVISVVLSQGSHAQNGVVSGCMDLTVNYYRNPHLNQSAFETDDKSKIILTDEHGDTSTVYTDGSQRYHYQRGDEAFSVMENENLSTGPNGEMQSFNNWVNVCDKPRIDNKGYLSLCVVEPVERLRFCGAHHSETLMQVHYLIQLPPQRAQLFLEKLNTRSENLQIRFIMSDLHDEYYLGPLQEGKNNHYFFNCRNNDKSQLECPQNTELPLSNEDVQVKTQGTTGFVPLAFYLSKISPTWTDKVISAVPPMLINEIGIATSIK